MIPVIMSDIIGSGDPQPAAAAEQALRWLEGLIREQRLGVGDALPAELVIAKAARVGRSSVREALTALKVLGIIASRRRGGIRIVRDPVLLELRHYFAGPLATRAAYADAMEFRAALEWGLGPLMLAHVNAKTVRALRGILDSVAAAAPDWATVHGAEIRFHTTLTASCGNALAKLFAHLYTPIFTLTTQDPPTAVDIAQWLQEHRVLADALERRDAAAFLKALRHHTHVYMRL